MAAVKWIKITTDVFDDEKVLMIESLPSADSIIVIWFKLLALAGKQNNGGVFIMNDRIAYTDEMLASIFRRDVNIVRLALRSFEEYGMIEIVDNVITIPNWSKHQTLDAYERKKERDRLYQHERRQKQRLLIQKSFEESSDNSSIDSFTVAKESLPVASLEEDKEKDIDIDIYKYIVEYLNEKLNTHYKTSSKKTKSLIHARIKEGFTKEDFETVIDKKCAEWLGDEKMEKYLRPETLFGTKFESYLNAKTTKWQQANTGVSVGTEQNDLDDVF